MLLPEQRGEGLSVSTRDFKGIVDVDIRDSFPDWEPFLQPKAPPGAPNVLMIVWDDVGYGAMDVHGGPIDTPNMRRIADGGLRYSNFHSTALCSRTRSSLLNGRNATSNNMACITEASAGFPGFSARIPFENGTIAEVLNERGWNTYAIGKWHLTPYKGLPLDDRTALEILTSPRPQPSEPRDRYVYYPNSSDVPESVAVNVRRRSYTIAAGVTVDTPEAEGVLFAHGGSAGGHSLYLQGGRLHYVYNWLGERIQHVTSESEIEPGKRVFTAEFQMTGDDEETSAVGTLTLFVDMEPVGSAEVMTQPGFFALTGDGLCVGRDSASAVSPDYAPPYQFIGGTIDRVIDVSGEHYVDHEKEVLAYLARD
jgi:hypothetical protein